MKQKMTECISALWVERERATWDQTCQKEIAIICPFAFQST